MDQEKFKGHSPRPWELSEPNGSGMGWRCGPAWLGINTWNEQGLADAYLITAAPDLLVENEQLREELRKVKEIARQRFEYGVNPAAAMMLIDIEGLVNAALKEEE